MTNIAVPSLLHTDRRVQQHQQQQQSGRRQHPPRRRLLSLQWIVGILCLFSGLFSFRYTSISSKAGGTAVTTTAAVSSFTKYSQDSRNVQSSRSSTTSTTNNDKGSTTTTSSSRFAYAFLISGCDPSAPMTYRPYIWNILVATKNLKQSMKTTSNTSESTINGQSTTTTTTDIIVMIQFQHNSTNTTRLPPSDIQWLKLYGDTIKIHYLPSLLKDNFYSSQFAKFHILEFIQYDRILYLDADVMPLCSLAYIFYWSTRRRTVDDNEHNKTMSNKNIDENDNNSHTSSSTTNRHHGKPFSLQPNVVLAWFTEPAHGGWFLLQPFQGAYQQLQDIINRRDEEAMKLPYPHWDPIIGWGAKLHEEWRGIGDDPSSTATTSTHSGGKKGESYGTLRTFGPPRHSTNWTFHGDFADQGLLYYWTRFHQKAVSIL